MYKKILKLAGPIIFANILQTVYQMTDIFWIGRRSTEGVAALSLAGPIIFFFISIGIGLTIAGTILVAQAWGAERYEKLNEIIGQSLLITTLFSVGVALLGYFLAGYIIGWMGAEPLVTQYAISYLKISFIGIISVFGYMTIQSLWRGMGEVTIPVYIVIGTVMLNVILDPLFIMGWGLFPALGVDGAAWSTLITQTIARGIALFLLYRKEKYHVKFSWDYFRIAADFIRKYMGLAIPSGIEMSARSLGMVVLAYIVAVYGTEVTAAYGVGNQIIAIMIFITLGFSMAVTTLSGQYYGAQKIDNIVVLKEKALSMSAGALLVLGALIFIFATPLVSIFVPGETEVIRISARFLHITALFLWSFSIQFVIAGLFRGLGEVKIPMGITLLTLWGLQIPIAYFGGKLYGVDAIWWSLTIANVLGAGVAWIRYELWKRKHLLR